jgi:hypothetical protein
MSLENSLKPWGLTYKQGACAMKMFFVAAVRLAKISFASS